LFFKFTHKIFSSNVNIKYQHSSLCIVYRIINALIYKCSETYRSFNFIKCFELKIIYCISLHIGDNLIQFSNESILCEVWSLYKSCIKQNVISSHKSDQRHAINSRVEELSFCPFSILFWLRYNNVFPCAVIPYTNCL